MVRGRAGARAMTGDGPVRIARMCKPARDCAVKARTQAVNQLKAVLVCAGPALREALSPLGNPARFRRCAQLASDTGFLGQRLSAAGGVLEEDPAVCPARGGPGGRAAPTPGPGTIWPPRARQLQPQERPDPQPRPGRGPGSDDHSHGIPL